MARNGIGRRVVDADFVLTVLWKTATVCAVVVLAVCTVILGMYVAMRVM